MPKKSKFMRYEELGIKTEDGDTTIKEEPIEDLSTVVEGICDESGKRLHGDSASVCSEGGNGHTQGAQGFDVPSSKCEEMCFKEEIEDVFVKEEPMEDLSAAPAGPSCEGAGERLQGDASSLRTKEEASEDPGSEGTDESFSTSETLRNYKEEEKDDNIEESLLVTAAVDGRVYKMNEQQINTKFVKEVEKHPVLYNFTLPGYSRKDQTGTAWAEVGKAVNMTEEADAQTHFSSPTPKQKHESLSQWINISLGENHPSSTPTQTSFKEDLDGEENHLIEKKAVDELFRESLSLEANGLNCKSIQNFSNELHSEDSPLSVHELVNNSAVGNLGETNSPMKLLPSGRMKSSVIEVSTPASNSNKPCLKAYRKKIFRYVDCKCMYKCRSIPEAERRTIFSKFSKLGNWQSQTTFIVKSVISSDVKRRIVGCKPFKFRTRKFFLNQVRVCKKVFLSSLGISDGRLTYALCKKAKNQFVSPDKRGQINVNKTSESKKSLVTAFLNQFPKYKSYYSLNSKQYFHPELTYKGLYMLYLESLKDDAKDKVGYKVFIKILKDYNVSIYVPKKDTCQTCDRLNNEIKYSTNDEKKQEVKVEKENHLRRAEYAREELRGATAVSKSKKDCIVFTFDMQKTLPIPFLNTSVAYYKRQMWLYNLGINTRHDNQGYMCLWNETEGKTGANEVCSSIFKFLSTRDLSEIKYLHSFSDCCPGQNRNRIFVAFMLYVCESKGIDTWTHDFLESGHSYLPNDADFGVIEKKKKVKENIFTADDWVRLIEKAKHRNPFKIIKMANSMKKFNELMNYFNFRNIDMEDNKFNWLKLKWIRVSKGIKMIEYKTTNDPSEKPKKIDFSKRQVLEMPTMVSNAYENGVKLSSEKYEDLQDMLPYIPPNLHKYFGALPHENQKKNRPKLEFYPDGYISDE